VWTRDARDTRPRADYSDFVLLTLLQVGETSGSGTQYEPPFARAAMRALKIGERIGGKGGIDEPFPEKPKSMHWKTYERLEAEVNGLRRRPPVCRRPGLLALWPSGVSENHRTSRLSAA